MKSYSKSPLPRTIIKDMTLSSDFPSMSIVSTEEQARRMAEMRADGSDSSDMTSITDGEDDSSSESERSSHDSTKHPCAMPDPDFKGNRTMKD